MYEMGEWKLDELITTAYTFDDVAAGTRTCTRVGTFAECTSSTHDDREAL